MKLESQSKLLQVLEAYPELEEQILKISPAFKSLKNPVLRRTVGRLATLGQVAQMGGLNETRFINTLRRQVGQEESAEESAAPAVTLEAAHSAGDPQWIAGEPQFVLDGTRLLEQGEVPVVKVTELLPQLENGRFLLLVTDFEPSPILAAMEKQERRIFTKVNSADESQHLTFIG